MQLDNVQCCFAKRMRTSSEEYHLRGRSSLFLSARAKKGKYFMYDLLRVVIEALGDLSFANGD